MQNRGITLAIAAVVATIVACSSTTDPVSKIVTFKTTMNGAGEVPANATTGAGTFIATLDTSTNVFTYDVAFSGLTSSASAGHIHGPAAATASSGTTINFVSLAGATFSVGATSGTGHGVATLSAANQITATINGDSLKKLLFAGLTYVNIHTSTNPGGEIRGQITKQ